MILIQYRETYWVESFNHQLFSNLPKQIHFSTRVFTVRLNLAIMDWVRHRLMHVCVHIMRLSYGAE